MIPTCYPCWNTHQPPPLANLPLDNARDGQSATDEPVGQLPPTENLLAPPAQCVLDKNREEHEWMSWL